MLNMEFNHCGLIHPCYVYDIRGEAENHRKRLNVKDFNPLVHKYSI